MRKGIEAYKKKSQQKKVVDREKVESATQDLQSAGIYASCGKDMIEYMDPIEIDNGNAEVSNYVICAYLEPDESHEINSELQKTIDSEKRIVLWGPVAALVAIFGWVCLLHL